MLNFVRISGKGAIVAMPLAVLILLLLVGTNTVLALEPAADEEDRIKACEKELCEMILSREATGPDLKCDLTKTWAQSDLDGGKDKGVSWIFGDARCRADIKLKRSDVVGALTKPEHTIKLPKQKVNCAVERSGKLEPVDIELAPKLKFKNGKAEKVWVNLGEMTGPMDVRGVVGAAATLEDSLGVFHKPMIKAINRFMHRQCKKNYGPRKKKAKGEAANEKPAKTDPPKAQDGAPAKESADTKPVNPPAAK